ncbi:hypothetical protein QUB68_24295 [Microcoleus sp. A006_D1]
MELLNYYFQTSTSFQPLFYQLKFVLCHKIRRRETQQLAPIALPNKL